MSFIINFIIYTIHTTKVGAKVTNHKSCRPKHRQPQHEWTGYLSHSTLKEWQFKRFKNLQQESPCKMPNFRTGTENISVTSIPDWKNITEYASTDFQRCPKHSCRWCQIAERPQCLPSFSCIQSSEEEAPTYGVYSRGTGSTSPHSEISLHPPTTTTCAFVKLSR